MSQATIRRCDVPTCRAEIPPAAKVWEFRVSLTLHNGEHGQATTVRECCGAACLTTTLSELIKAAEEKVAERVKAAAAKTDCHSIASH